MEEWISKTLNIENMSMLSYINKYSYILRSVKMLDTVQYLLLVQTKKRHCFCNNANNSILFNITIIKIFRMISTN